MFINEDEEANFFFVLFCFLIDVNYIIYMNDCNLDNLIKIINKSEEVNK